MTTNTTPGAEPVTALENEVLRLNGLLRVSNTERNDAQKARARLLADREKLRKALKAAADRMEAVSRGIPVENRAEGVSQATHVRHMAGHLAQHAKIARAALKETGEQ